MKKTLYFLLLICASGYAQQPGLAGNGTVTPMGTTNPPQVDKRKRVTFTYDSAGNQIVRKVIALSPARHAANDSLVDDSSPVNKVNNLLKSDEYDGLSYYPNPVRSELYLQWKEVKNNDLLSLEIYDMSGKLVNRIEGQSNNNSATINFDSYPKGMYQLLLLYNDGKKVLQILKQ